MKTEQTCPEEMVKNFIWWALSFSPSRENEPCPECGAHIVNNLREEHIHPTTLKRLREECQSFWECTRSAIETSFKRTKVSPLVDTEDYHLSRVGCGFFWARQSSDWGFDFWPQDEKAQMMSSAAKFLPIFLQKGTDGFLHAIDDPQLEWYTEHRKAEKEIMEAFEKARTEAKAAKE